MGYGGLLSFIGSLPLCPGPQFWKSHLRGLGWDVSSNVRSEFAFLGENWEPMADTWKLAVGRVLPIIRLQILPEIITGVVPLQGSFCLLCG